MSDKVIEKRLAYIVTVTVVQLCTIVKKFIANEFLYVTRSGTIAYFALREIPILNIQDAVTT